MKRRTIFVKGEIYHIYNKSIAGYKILQDFKNSQRFYNVLDYYNSKLIEISYSEYLSKNNQYQEENILYPKDFSLVKFIAFCLMPDHYHLLIKLLEEKILSKYISDVENSFSKFFNIKFKRKGPLWQSRFQAVRIKTNEQLSHVTRYIHLNPTTSNLVTRPEDWRFSSYKDYIEDDKILKEIMNEISIKNKESYQKFVEDRMDYQRRLKMIKKLILEDN